MYKAFLIFIVLISYCLDALPQKIILLQGAENTKNSNNSLELNWIGKERAAALPYLLLSNPNFFTTIPVALFTVKKDAKNTIFLDFLKPFSDRINIEITTDYSADQESAIAQYILTANSFDNQNIVIAWPNENMEKLIKNLKVKEPFKNWPQDVYDRAFVITYDKTGKASLQDLPQKLLMKDSSQ